MTKEALDELQLYILNNAVFPSDHCGSGRVVPLSLLRGWIQRERQKLGSPAECVAGHTATTKRDRSDATVHPPESQPQFRYIEPWIPNRERD
jgi:hypothetical protein